MSQIKNVYERDVQNSLLLSVREINKLYCSNHKLDNMVNISSKNVIKKDA